MFGIYEKACHYSETTDARPRCCLRTWYYLLDGIAHGGWRRVTRESGSLLDYHIGRHRVDLLYRKGLEPKVFPEARQFSMKWPIFPIVAGLLLMAPLWLVVKEYLVYGFTSLINTVRLEPIAFTPDEIREDLLASVHTVLLAPVLEELCYRQLAISPFRRRGAQIAVCMVMAVLFGIPHVRNFFGSFLAATLFGLVFVWSRNIWYAVLLHAGSNLTATLVGVYCVFGLGEVQMSKIPVIFMPDAKFTIACVVLAIAGLFLLKRKLPQKSGTLNTESLT